MVGRIRFHFPPSNPTRVPLPLPFLPLPLLRRSSTFSTPVRQRLSRFSLPFLPKPSSRIFCTVDAPVVGVGVDDEKFGGKQVISVTPQLYQYILANVREPEILRELREETATMQGSQMQGYSSLAVALVLPESGHLVACERDERCLEIARKYYELAGVSHKVDVKHGLAVDALRSLILNGETCSYDFAFIDAEKRMYDEYFELLFQLVKIGGIIVIDNVLWHGKVADHRVNDPKTISIRKFNEKVYKDRRINISMVPIGDGMTICRKISHS